jgi:hypothetical protein
MPTPARSRSVSTRRQPLVLLDYSHVGTSVVVHHRWYDDETQFGKRLKVRRVRLGVRLADVRVEAGLVDRDQFVPLDRVDIVDSFAVRIDISVHVQRVVRHTGRESCTGVVGRYRVITPLDFQLWTNWSGTGSHKGA